MQEIPSISAMSPKLIQQEEEWLNCLQQQISSQYQRAAIVLSGETLWEREKASKWLDILSYQTVLWVSDDIPEALPFNKARTQLGKEYNAIVFDASKSFETDSFGAISGTLQGGGMFFVLLPSISDWPDLKSSRFLQRALPILQQHKNVFFIQQNTTLPVIPKHRILQQIKNKITAPYRTLEQQQVVSAIKKNILGKNNNSMVLISDRGRGKSSALGFAIGELLQQGIENIIVTAPRLTTCEPIFRHAQQLLPDAKISQNELLWKAGKLKFIAPDTLLINKLQADFLLVDEAAAIPLPILEKLLQLYPVVIFATTVHGYEGTGRGFILKFNKVLDQLTPGWQSYNMEEPIRWAQDDPVECWIDKLLCMDVELAEVPDFDHINIPDCTVREVDRDELVKDDKKLSSLFALLVFAHYRTKPSDLKHLLDDKKVRLYTLGYKNMILAAALINQEGGFDTELSSEIYRGERRPQGHLLAQTLTFHAGCEYAATLNYSRIMRIAVHPQLQGNGLGRYFLNNIVNKEREKNVVAIGASFGSDIQLIRFWKAAGFEIVRVGFTRDHASGAHSAVMFKPFDSLGEDVFSNVRGKFVRYLPSWIKGPLSGLSENMLQLLFKEAVIDSNLLSDSDWKEVRSFSSSHRGYEACMWPVKKFVRRHEYLLDALSGIDKQIVVEKIKQDLSWADIAKHKKLRGKAEAIGLLRSAIAKMLRAIE
jgi:tRNA(Met) cytidine acetyltransferase